MLENVLDVYGHKKGRLNFYSIKFKRRFSACISATLVDFVHSARGGRSVGFFGDDDDDGGYRLCRKIGIIEPLLPEKRVAAVVHDDAYYLITTRPALLFQQHVRPLKSDPRFDALYRIVSGVEECDNVTDFCDLCRACSYFRCHRKRRRWFEWNAWYKMATHLMGRCWQKLVGNRDGRFTLTLARRLAKISRRVEVLPFRSHGDDGGFASCEILYTERERLGLVYAKSCRDVVQHVSPMIVSFPAFRPGMKDVARIECTDWSPLFVDKEHWKLYSYEHYLKILNVNDLSKILRYFHSNPPENDKHRFIYDDVRKIYDILK